MKTYIIKRYGQNAANQDCREMVVGTIKIDGDHWDAKTAAHKEFSCYNNQFFSAQDLAGRTRNADRIAAIEADSWRKRGLPADWMVVSR